MEWWWGCWRWEAEEWRERMVEVRRGRVDAGGERVW